MFRLLLIFATVATLQAQPVSYGLKAGSFINDAGTDSWLFWSSSQNRLTGGPAVELHLPWRLSVEFNALYRTGRTSQSSPVRFGKTQNPYLSSFSEKTRTWDFPVLLKYRLSGGSRRPFVSAGASWSHLRSDLTSGYYCLGPEGSCRPPESAADFSGIRMSKARTTRLGPAAGAGIDIRTEHLTITPEVRWSGWSGDTRNQVTVMVGFAFGR